MVNFSKTVKEYQENDKKLGERFFGAPERVNSKQDDEPVFYLMSAKAKDVAFTLNFLIFDSWKNQIKTNFELCKNRQYISLFEFYNFRCCFKSYLFLLSVAVNSDVDL